MRSALRLGAVGALALLSLVAGSVATPTAAHQAQVVQPPEPPDDLVRERPAEALLERATRARDAAEGTAGKAAAGLPGSRSTDAGAAGAGSAPTPDDSSLLVTFEADASQSDIADTVADADAEGHTAIAGIDVVEIETGAADRAAVEAALAADPDVATVEPNLVRTASKIPDDPAFSDQQAALASVGVPTAWEVADPRASVTVAVLDTGVDLDHPDLAPNLVPGRDIINGDADPSDDNGHGTAVAGVVGAATDNGVAGAGVAWNARIMPVKVLGADGVATDAEVAAGIVWAADHGADIINMSLGGYGGSFAIDEAVAYALDRDVVLVASAGNGGSRALVYPAGAPGVLGVSATDSQGRVAWFSDYGPWMMLAAPGIDVVTTASAPGADPALAAETGTSFASPIVAGVAALVRERHPGWAWDQVAWELARTARDAGPAGADDAYGFGIVDAAAALGVGPRSDLAQPNLAGDAGDFPIGARLISVGAVASESIGVEMDDDWFAFDVPATAVATMTVTPPPLLDDGVRSQEIDPVVQVYGPGGGLVASADAGLAGEPETLAVNVPAGRHTIRVRSWSAATSPGPYNVVVQLGAPTGVVALEGAKPWFASTSPAPHARNVPTTTKPAVTFDRALNPSSVNADTVWLMDGRAGWFIPATVTRSGQTATVSPAAPLAPGRPYLLVVWGVADAVGEDVPPTFFPFVTASAGRPTYNVTATYSPLSVDLDGSGYDDVFWYAPGSAGDSVWFFDPWGPFGVRTQVSGTYKPLSGDFNGNGYEDIFWYAPGSAADSMWRSGPNGITSIAMPVTGTYRPVVGDFDRNGYDDIFWHAPGSAADSIWKFGPGGHSRQAVSVSGSYTPLAGDFNRDGYDDVFWYAPGTTADSMWLGRASGFTKATAPSVVTTYRGRVLDANGDGFDDIFWYTGGTSVLWRGGPGGFSGGSGPAIASTARAIPGDFTGDLRDDLIAYVPGTPKEPMYRGSAGGLG